MSGGRAWVFGDDVDTDALAPGRYMKGSLEALAGHCLEALDPDFAAAVAAGDIVVAGRNFGIGSSREQAAQALRHLGVSAVLARSFGGIFYRNAFNNGLPVLVCGEVDRLNPGDRLRLDAAAGRVDNLTTGEVLACEPVPPHLLALVEAGGLVAHLEGRLARQGKEPTR
jgi:3-isopropylmalate/(R)-2-methylmalate dehydratase small subunit